MQTLARLLARGEAPPNPRMAVAAVELAESYHACGVLFGG
jgi:hypothetical protein